MKHSKLHSSILVAAGLALVLATTARAADTTTSTINFSDPSRPGILKIQVARGDLAITGTGESGITVRSEAPELKSVSRKDGLRVLSTSSGFSLTEKDNVVTLESGGDGFHGGSADFALTVPRNTHVIVQSSWGGDITCSSLAGDVEINSMNGEVELESHAGGAIVSTMSGEVHASILSLQDDRPLSFTSMNGDVLIRLPADTKANVRLRTHNGSILTDFDEIALVTRTESSGRTPHARRTIAPTGTLPPEAREAIREAVRAGTEIAREVAEAAREGAQAAREAAEAAREGAEADSPGIAPRAPRTHTPIPSMPPIPPIPPIPPMTGGKLVTGTLNGGGPEISVATMNGDVTLRKRDTN
ncbi:MAG: DUF4097 family beta strand repeat-containing protein [Opitutus sp.]